MSHSSSPPLSPHHPHPQSHTFPTPSPTSLFFHTLSRYKFTAALSLTQQSVHYEFFKNLLLSEEVYMDARFGIAAKRSHVADRDTSRDSLRSASSSGSGAPVTPQSSATTPKSSGISSLIGGIFGKRGTPSSEPSTPTRTNESSSSTRRASISLTRSSSSQSLHSPSPASSSSIERHYEDCIAYLRDPLTQLLPEHELHKSEHVALSRDLSQGLYRYIQLRLEMIAFYRMLSSNQGRIPNFRSYCLVLRNFQQKYLTRGSVSSSSHHQQSAHPCLSRLFFNARMELELVLHLMEEADLVGRMHYVPATMKLFQVEKTFERWIQRYNAAPEWGNGSIHASGGSGTSTAHSHDSTHPEGNTTSMGLPSRTTSILKRVSTTKGSLQSLLKDKFGGSGSSIASTSNLPASATIAAPTSSNALDDDSSESSDSRTHTGLGSPPDSSTYSAPTFPSSASASKKTSLLESTNLFKWLKLTYKFCLSKYSWYFFDVLKQRPSSMHTFHHLLKDRAVVSYTEWMTNFCTKQSSPEFVCLIYNAQEDEGHAPPLGTDKGYSLRHMCDRKLETLSGMRQWPCVYLYPQDADKDTLMRRHWPSLLSLIVEKDDSITSKLSPLSFIDEKANKTYFFSRVDERMYLCFVYDSAVEGKSKTYKLTAEFIYQMNLYVRFSKLFSFLTAG